MGTVAFDTDVSKTVEIDKTVNLLVDKEVNATVELVGSLATAEASADAIGFENVLAETDTFAQVSDLGAFAFSESLAAGNDVVEELGAIGDFVFQDDNENGLQDAGEPGIEGVDVTLLDADGTTVLDTTTTDSDGAYLFDNLAAGTYFIEFPDTVDFDNDGIPDPVTARQVGDDPTIDSDATLSDAIALSAGEIDRTIDAGYVAGGAAETQQLNFVYVIDATGSTAFEFITDVSDPFDGVDADGNPITFDDDQNFPPAPTTPEDDGLQSPNDPGDVIDAEIAALKNFTNSLIATINDEIAEAADDDVTLTVDANVALVRIFDASGQTEAPGSVTVFSIPDDVDALFAALEDTGSSGNTNLTAGIEEAEDAFAAIPTNAADVDGPTNQLLYLTDADSLVLVDSEPDEVAAAIDDLDDAVPGLEREAFFFENFRVANDPAVVAAEAQLNVISGDDAFETVEAVGELVFDQDIFVA